MPRPPFPATSGLHGKPTILGTSLQRIVGDVGGGAPQGHQIKAVQIGGPNGGCIPNHLLDVSVDYGALQELGAMMGSGGLVVMDERSCMVDVAKFFMEFVRNESCGKCGQVRREGTTRMHENGADSPVQPEHARTATGLRRGQRDRPSARLDR